MKTSGIGLALLSIAAVAHASAQSLVSPSKWTMNDGQGGFCVEYLLDPAKANKVAPKEAVLTPANAASGLSAWMTKQVKDEPDFGKWIPASLCVGLYRSVSINDKVVATMKGEVPVMLITHTVAGSSLKGVPVASVLVGFYTDNDGLVKAAERVGHKVEKARRVATKRPGSGVATDWTVKFDGVTLAWQGAPNGDNRVLPTRSVSFGYAGPRGGIWTGAMEVTIPTGRTLIGSLGIEGKGDLSKALRASPDRVIGPMETGGQGSLSFTMTGSR